MARINSFRGRFAFLSNFYSEAFQFEHKWYATSEHAYQAAKALHECDAEAIRSVGSPGEAKRLGRLVVMHPTFEERKLAIMEAILREKFKAPALRIMLQGTVGFELVEGNTWGDTYWGVCNGVGQNNLGKLLMKVRDGH